MLQFMSDFFTYKSTNLIFTRIFEQIIFNYGTKAIASLFIIAFVVYMIRRAFWG